MWKCYVDYSFFNLCTYAPCTELCIFSPVMKTESIMLHTWRTGTYVIYTEIIWSCFVAGNLESNLLKIIITKFFFVCNIFCVKIFFLSWNNIASVHSVYCIFCALYVWPCYFFPAMHTEFIKLQICITAKNNRKLICSWKFSCTLDTCPKSKKVIFCRGAINPP